MCRIPMMWWRRGVSDTGGRHTTHALMGASLLNLARTLLALATLEMASAWGSGTIFTFPPPPPPHSNDILTDGIGGIPIFVFIPVLFLIITIPLRIYFFRRMAQRRPLLQNNGFQVGMQQPGGINQHNGFVPGGGVQLGATAGFGCFGGSVMGTGMPVNTGAPVVVNAVPVDAAGLPAGHVYNGNV